MVDTIMKWLDEPSRQHRIPMRRPMMSGPLLLPSYLHYGQHAMSQLDCRCSICAGDDGT